MGYLVEPCKDLFRLGNIYTALLAQIFVFASTLRNS